MRYILRHRCGFFFCVSCELKKNVYYTITGLVYSYVLNPDNWWWCWVPLQSYWFFICWIYPSLMKRCWIFKYNSGFVYFSLQFYKVLNEFLFQLLCREKGFELVNFIPLLGFQECTTHLLSIWLFISYFISLKQFSVF